MCFSFSISVIRMVYQYQAPVVFCCVETESLIWINTYRSSVHHYYRSSRLKYNTMSNVHTLTSTDCLIVTIISHTQGVHIVSLQFKHFITKAIHRMLGCYCVWGFLFVCLGWVFWFFWGTVVVFCFYLFCFLSDLFNIFCGYPIF